MKPISKPSLFAFSLALSLLLLWLVVMFFIPMAYEWYWTKAVGSDLETQYGFHLEQGEIQLNNKPNKQEVILVTKLTPGGPFSKAGFKANDIIGWWDYYSGDTAIQFFKRLNACGKYHKTVRFEVVNIADLSKGVFESRRAITIAPEAK